MVHNVRTGVTQCYDYEPTDPFSLSDVHLQTAYRDRDGGIWIGSYFGGINYLPRINNTSPITSPRVDIAHVALRTKGASDGGGTRRDVYG